MDARNDPVWMAHVVEVGRGADQPVEPGLEIDETVKFLGKRLPVTHEDHRARAAAPLRDRADRQPGPGARAATSSSRSTAGRA